MRAIRIFYISLLCGSTLPAESRPTAEEVLAAVLRQPLATTNPAIKSYEAEIEMGTVGMRYSFWYQKTNGTALWVIDSHDGTPVMVAAEGTLAVYDTLTSTIFLMTNKYASLEFKSKYSDEPGKSSVNMGAAFSSDPSGAEGEIRLPPPLVFSNFPPKLESKGEGVFEVRCTGGRKVPSTGESVTWSFTGVTDWPAKDIPYRVMEMRGAPFLNVLVKSVNQPIPEGYFRFPLQGLLTAGLPVRRLSSGDTNEISQISSLMMANVGIRRALNDQDPQKARREIQKICQSMGSEAGNQKLLQASQEVVDVYKKLGKDPQAWEKILSEVTEEQWESIRLSEFSGLSSEEFAKTRADPAFRKQLADKMVASLAEGSQKKDGQGLTPEESISGAIRGVMDAVNRLESVNFDALRAKDQKIASQLRQAFQLELSPTK